MDDCSTPTLLKAPPSQLCTELGSVSLQEGRGAPTRDVEGRCLWAPVTRLRANTWLTDRKAPQKRVCGTMGAEPIPESHAVVPTEAKEGHLEKRSTTRTPQLCFTALEPRSLPPRRWASGRSAWKSSDAAWRQHFTTHFTRSNTPPFVPYKGSLISEQ